MTKFFFFDRLKIVTRSARWMSINDYLFLPAKGHACNFVKTVGTLSISLETMRENFVLPASNIKKQPIHHLPQWL